MTDEEARERARKRLEERTARRDAGEAHSRAHREASPSGGSRRSGHPDAAGRHHWDARPVDFLFAIGQAASSVVRALGPKRLAIGLAIVFLAVLAAAGVRSCASCAAERSEPAPEPVSEAQQPPEDPVDQAALSAILGDDLTAQLVKAAETSDDAAWIAAHPQAFAVDGEAVQYKLLKLAATEPEAVPFVRLFPDSYPAEEAGSCDEARKGEVPRLYQWDRRWGFTVYSSTTFALTGCCPTALSMVYQGLTGKSDLSPYDMGVRAKQGGYMAAFDGTDSSFLANEAASLGLSCTPIGVDAASLRAALQGGAVVICNVGPGDFTDNGHFFVITGLADDGTLKVNDPYSAERSNRTWSIDQVIGQAKALWAYRPAQG